MLEVDFNNRDEFNRRSIALNIIKLLESDINISPLMIDGNWGTGKTEFCCKLIKLYEEQTSSSVLYIDAYKSDHTDEPLLTIISEVLKLIPEEDGKRQKAIDKILPAIRFGLKASLKAGVAHLLRTDAAEMLESFESEVTNATTAAIDASVESLLKNHIEAEQNLTTLQDVLKKLTDEKPITIFIDELDRCKPSYAIKLLEVIKHTFNVPKVSFVLVTNSEQLEASIEHCYGKGVNASKYLDKFISYRIALPTTKPEINSRDTSQVSFIHFRNLIQSSQSLVGTYLQGESSQELFDLVKQVILVHNLSLREVETLVRHIEVLNIVKPQYLSNRGKLGYHMLYMTGILFSVITPKIAQEIHSRSATDRHIASLYEVTSLPELPVQSFKQPEYYKTLTVLMAEHCVANTLFKIEEDDQETWHSLFGRMFGNIYEIPDNSLEIVASVTDIMRLYQA
ncbi:TPA: KAP family P-loop NTPase fold protein [Vibrio harveyi]